MFQCDDPASEENRTASREDLGREAPKWAIRERLACKKFFQPKRTKQVNCSASCLGKTRRQKHSPRGKPDHLLECTYCKDLFLNPRPKRFCSKKCNEKNRWVRA